MMRWGRGWWKGEEGGLNKEKTFTFLKETGIYSFKAFGCIFSSAISSFPSSLSLPFSYPFILPVILHIPRLSLCSLQRRRPDMKPLRWIMYPQSKRLKSGLSHCVRVWKERKHFYADVTLPHWGFGDLTTGPLDSKMVCKQQPAGKIWIFTEQLLIHSSNKKCYFLCWLMLM